MGVFFGFVAIWKCGSNLFKLDFVANDGLKHYNSVTGSLIEIRFNCKVFRRNQMRDRVRENDQLSYWFQSSNTHTNIPHYIGEIASEFYKNLMYTN